jgi:serine/threonine protein kinase
MTIPPGCPEIADWQLSPDGPVSEDRQQEFDRHLESCPACQERLDQAGACGESITKTLRQVGDPTVRSSDWPLLQVMDRLCDAWSPSKQEPEPAADLFFLRPANLPGVLGLLGDYQVREVIGQGGMGLVLKAYDPTLDRLVAIKVLAPTLAGSATARLRFTREAKGAAAVSHDHIVVVHGVHEAEGLPYLVMEYIAGESLQERIERSGPLELSDIVRIGLQTASGLAAAHAQGLIHRDIKPANLLLENGLARVTITDFGLARAADDVQLTQKGVVAGTPEYMSPEQACGEAVDDRSDLFSLGSVLYTMATGVPPFRGSTALAVLRRVSDQEPPPIRTLNPSVSAWLETLIGRLMTKHPADRLQTAAEVAKLLEGYLAHLPQPAALPAPPIPSSPNADEMRPQPGRARKMLRGITPQVYVPALLFLLVALGFGFLHFQAAGPEPGRPEGLQEYAQSFRGTSQNRAGIRLLGPDAQDHVLFEPDGLRITLPAGYAGQRPASGVAIAKTVKGDFEITLRFEILQEREQVNGTTPPTRLTLDAGVDRGEKIVATLSRQVQAKTGSEFLTWISPVGKNQWQGRHFPTAAKAGRLRLARSGHLISYLVAEGDSDQFRLLHQAQFVTGNLQDVQIIATTLSPAAMLDVRLTDLLIRAQAVADSPAVAPAEAPPPPPGLGGSRVFLTITAVLVLGLSLFFGVWVFARQRRGDAGAMAEASFQPAAAAPPVTFPCPACGKCLKARAELAGKQVKCPSCGQAAEVPALPSADPPPVLTPPRGRFALPIWSWFLAAFVLVAVIGVALWWFWPASMDAASLLNVTLGATPVADVEESGFSYQEYDKDVPFRWTDGRGRLVIPIDRNKTPQGLYMEIFLYRPPGVAGWMRILANQQDLFHQEVRHYRFRRIFDLRGIDLGDKLVLDIISDTFQPQGIMDKGTNNDPRTLGVQVRAIKLLPGMDEKAADSR